MIAASKMPLKMEGRPSVFTVPACADPLDTANWSPLIEGKNIVCVGMYDSMLHMLLRDFDDWQPASMAIGSGGDLSLSAGSYIATPTRQPPTHSDTAMRRQNFVAPIVQVIPGNTVTRTAVYVAIVRPDDANTGSVEAPYINELGLLATNGTLLAHYVTPEDLTNATRPSLKYAKSNLQWLVIKWEIEFTGVEP